MKIFELRKIKKNKEILEFISINKVELENENISPGIYLNVIELTQEEVRNNKKEYIYISDYCESNINKCTFKDILRLSKLNSLVGKESKFPSNTTPRSSAISKIK